MPIWYHLVMDVNVKNLDPGVVARLAEQAEAEGMSQQEWIRQTLRRSASRPSPAELRTQRADTTPMSDARFAEIRERAGKRRRSAAEQLGA